MPDSPEREVASPALSARSSRNERAYAIVSRLVRPKCEPVVVWLLGPEGEPWSAAVSACFGGSASVVRIGPGEQVSQPGEGSAAVQADAIELQAGGSGELTEAFAGALASSPAPQLVWVNLGSQTRRTIEELWDKLAKAELLIVRCWGGPAAGEPGFEPSIWQVGATLRTKQFVLVALVRDRDDDARAVQVDACFIPGLAWQRQLGEGIVTLELGWR